MNTDPSGVGSVRRARERAEAGLTPEYHGINMNHSSQRDLGDGRHLRGGGRRPPPVPMASRQRPKNSAIPNPSNPPPMSQWPLSGNEELRGTPSDETSIRGRAPQRPPRPSNPPSFLDASHAQDYTPNMSYHNNPQPPPSTRQNRPNQGPYVESSGQNISVPPPVAAYDSANQSSQMSMPFQSNRRNPGLGPPPSARRAPTSFYSTNSHVSPIPEETPENTQRNARSFASSKVIPSSWGSAPPESLMLRSPYESPDEGDSDDMPIHEEEVTLVRQASLGKRGKPSLRTFSKSQIEQLSDNNNDTNDTPENRVVVDNTATKNPATVVGTAATQSPKPSPIHQSPQFDIEKPPIAKHPARLRSFSESSADSYDSEFEKNRFPMMQPGNSPTAWELKELGLNTNAGPGISERRPDLKLPPRLDIDAVKEAESRGSLTSLHDLIMRATKLASNLDRGRTASRLGILDMFNGSGDLKKSQGRRSGDISDMLASFPPPGIVTPSGSSPWPREPRSRANPDVMFPGDESITSSKRRRYCCGMRRWVFILLCIFLVILVAAAVIVPVMLIVVPNQREATSKPQSSSIAIGSNACKESNPCMNGGISIGSSGSCGCVCVDGFSGSTCDVSKTSSCVTRDISTDSVDIPNATFGSALPRLFEDSSETFGIPLNASKILGQFNSADVSCTSENALVTFNGSNRKRNPPVIQGDNIKLPESFAQHLHKHHGSHTMNSHSRPWNIKARDETPPVKPTSTTAADSDEPIKTPNKKEISKEAIDFARVVVLYIYETTERFRIATLAHDTIERYFKQPSNGSNNKLKPLVLSYGQANFTLDFNVFSIKLGNGTVLGGK